MAEKERKLPDVLEHNFIICDNTLNRKGWRLLVEGINMEGFLKNPVCLYIHDMEEIPVGKWKNLRIENGQFLGTAEFDRNDPDAVKIYWKYADGYMSGCSLHVLPIEESEDPALLLPGQRFATLTKSDLIEISVVPVPGQKNAVKLSTPEGCDYKLNIINTNQNQIKMDPEKKDNKEFEALQTQLEVQKKLNAKNLVKLHVQRGVVQEAEVEHLTKLAETDAETVEKMLDARKPVETHETKEKPSETTEGKKLNETIKQFTQGADAGKKTTDERKDWTFFDYFRKDSAALAIMSEKEPERYKKLELAFNEEAKKMNLKAE